MSAIIICLQFWAISLSCQSAVHIIFGGNFGGAIFKVYRIALQTIKTFSMPVTEVEYPALTFCRPNLDAGDYTRAVFNNLHFVDECKDCSSQKGDKLRDNV